MKAMPGTRLQIAKFINDIENINDSDIIFEYVREITSFYTSEYKSRNEILTQHEMDIEVLVRHYNIYNDLLKGHEPQNELERQMNYYWKPNPQYQPAVSNIQQALEFLIWESSKLKIFLPIEKLDKLGLKNIKRRTIKLPNFKEVTHKCETFEEELKEWRKINKDAKSEYVIESLFDYAIHFYKMNGNIINYPDIPQKLARIFRYDKKICWEFCNECKGKDLEGVAIIYRKYWDAGRIDVRSGKPIFNEFVTTKKNQYMKFMRFAFPEKYKKKNKGCDN